MKLKEIIVLTEDENERALLTRRVARMMKVAYDATFYDAEYLRAAAWLLSPRQVPADTATQRIVNMFKKLHSQDIDDRAARRLMYQEFVTKPGFGKMAYKLNQMDKDAP